MTAYEIPNLRFSAEAGAIVARRRFVVINGSGKGVQAGAGVAVVGASMNDPKSGEVLEIADGIVIVEAGAAVAAGAEVESDADGKAITLATGKKAGFAMTGAGAAGELMAVKI